MSNLNEKIPLEIRVKSSFYPVIDYKEKYGEESLTINEAKGEIEKFRISESQSVGQKVLRQVYENNIEYGTIWVHLGRDYFKQISKVRE